MDATVQAILTMVVSALQPMGEDFARKAGLDAGEHVRDMVASTENTLDDSVVEVAEVAVKAFLEGLAAPAE